MYAVSYTVKKNQFLIACDIDLLSASNEVHGAHYPFIIIIS